MIVDIRKIRFLEVYDGDDGIVYSPTDDVLALDKAHICVEYEESASVSFLRETQGEKDRKVDRPKRKLSVKC